MKPRRVDSLIVEPPTFDWRHPRYEPIFEQRLAALERIRAHPEQLPALKEYYRANPIDFINDWGMTYDPRNAEVDLPTMIPFILYPKQREWIEWVLELWRSTRKGLTEKSRDMGISWCAIGLSCTLGIFLEGISIGFASLKA